MNIPNLVSGNITLESLKVGFNIAATKVGEAVITIAPIAAESFKLYSLYSMYEAALSDMFCLKTFRHGTNPYAAFRITWTGPDLTRAGIEGEAAYIKGVTGKESRWAPRDQGLRAFYVFEDFAPSRGTKMDDIFSYCVTKVNAKWYSLRSTASFICSVLPLPSSWRGVLPHELVSMVESIRGATIFGALCPTVKFHLDPKRINSSAENAILLHPDTEGNAGAGAMYTRSQLSFTDCGVLGVLKNGLNRDLIDRISDNKTQFMWGLTQLVTAVAFTAYFFPAYVPGSWVVTSAVTSITALSRFGFLGDGVRFALSAPPIFYALLQI
jgi:hypothetical protein